MNFTIHFTIFSKNPSVGAAAGAAGIAHATGATCTGDIGICTCGATGATGGTGICCGTGTTASHTRLYGFAGACAGICVCIGSIFLFCL
jgi:hypothetical protein